VLGAGGAVGHAFHSGVLSALWEATGWDARHAEVIVGTSAGSLVGALLRAGLSGADLAARAMDMPLSPEGRRLVSIAETARGEQPAIPSRPPRASRRVVPAMSAPGAFVRAAMQPWNARPAALMAAAMPEGLVPTELIATGLRPLFDRWPAPSLWINAVALESGRRVTFGRDTRVRTDVATAVAASCAIPGFFAPVAIEGVRYVDGGVHSPTNADLVAGLGLDLVVVSSPMSMARNGARLAPDQLARRLSLMALTREVRRIRASDTPVLTFQPTSTVLDVMGWNAMDASRRADVTRTARTSAARRLERPDARDRVALLGERAPRPA
jgi:NTE family protein